MKLRWIIACLLVAAACSSRPEEKIPAVRIPIVSTQLSHPSVSSFQQDSTGRIWIGTESGLNRYNGYDFHQYFHSQDSASLPDNRIYDMCLDRSGRLWVGTENGIAYYSEKDQFVRVPVKSDEKAVYQVLTDKEGQIIINLLEDLCVYDPEAEVFKSVVIGFDRFYSYHPRCYLDKEDRLWAVSPKEIRVFDTDGFANLDNFPTYHFVTASALLENGEIWMAGRRKMSIFNTRTSQFQKMPQAITAAFSGKEVQLIYELAPGHVFFKTSEGDLWLYKIQEDILTPLSRGSLDLPYFFDTQRVYRDFSGNLWFGSDDKGFRFVPMPSSPFNIKDMHRNTEGSASTPSLSVAPDGDLWAFTLHYGLVRFNPENSETTFPRVEGHPAQNQSDILQTNLPLVFVPSDGSLWLSYPNEQRLLHGRYQAGKILLEEEYPAFYPRTALEDAEGGIWFGTRNEYLVHIAKGSKELERVQIFPYQTTFIHCLLLLGDEILIGAYDEPLTLLDIHTRQTRRLEIAGGDAAVSPGGELFYPTALLQDGNGNIWIGTRYRGILRYKLEDKTLNTVPGIPSGNIFSLIQDKDGQIWAATADGIACYNPEQECFLGYYPPMGTGGTAFYERASVRMKDGMLVFGGAHGLTTVNPEEASVRMSVPLVFEDIKVHNQEVLPGNGIIDKVLSRHPRVVLPHTDNSFSVSFSVPDFCNLYRLRYLYKLEGRDKDWVELGPSREAYFANVPAGRYVLRVRANLQPDFDSYEESALSVTVLPPLWGSWWAWTLYILMAGGLLLWIWSVRRRLLREQASALEAEKEKEQERRVNQMNMAFFSNISHEFRTPLTMISGPVSELSRNENLPAEDRRQLDIVQRSVSRMLSLVNQLMDVNKLENGALKLQVKKADVVPLLRDSLAIFRLNSKSRGITLDVKGLEYPLVTWFDEDKVQKILANLLSNALKFTPSGGNVTVDVDETAGRMMRITVSDSGPGIPVSELEKIFDRYYQLENGQEGKYNYGTGIGLYYARSLATVHHGSLVAGNRAGGHGAVFTLLLPMAEEAYSEQERIPMQSPVNGEYPLETVWGEVVENDNKEAESLPLLLAVDDDPDILHYLEVLFGGSYQVIVASNADEALTLAQDRSPDLVLSDVAMPGKSGFDLCRELKSNLQLSHIPVILVTAMGAVQNQVQGLEYGADAYVTKPFDPAYLKALVKSQLENRQRMQKLLNQATESSEVDDLSTRDKAFLNELYALMDREISNEDLDVSLLTEMLKISRTKLYYKIKGLTGKTPSEFFMQYKLNVAAKLVKEGKMNISEIAFRTGFSTLPHFSKAFKKQFGISPSKYQG